MLYFVTGLCIKQLTCAFKNGAKFILHIPGDSIVIIIFIYFSVATYIFRFYNSLSSADLFMLSVTYIV